MKKISVNQMEVISAGEHETTYAVICGVLMTMAGAPWAAGIAMVGTPLAGYAFSLGWSAFSSWVCSPKK